MRISVQWLTGNDNKPKGLWPIEWLAITYSILTTLAMFVLWPDMDHPRDMLADRLYIFLGTILLWRIYLFWPRRLMTFIRITAQMALLSYWYPDTYEFNRTFPNLDHIFARWDAVLFSCQPSLEFSRLCPWPWFSEAVNMGYFSYYPMIVAVMVFFFLCRNNHYEKASFTVMCSFFIFYLIYIFLPVAGPQFYFQAITGMCRKRDIPVFRYLLQPSYRHAPITGLCRRFFLSFSRMGAGFRRRPTAAFPSSHIGITFIP